MSLAADVGKANIYRVVVRCARYGRICCATSYTYYPRTILYFDRRGIGSLRNDTSVNIDFIGPLRDAYRSPGRDVSRPEQVIRSV